MTHAAGILFTDGKNILLLKRSDEGDEPNTWGLPFGGSKDGETPEQTAIRETKEETGISSIPGSQIDKVDRRMGGKRCVVLVYRVDEAFDVKLSKEHNDSKWASLGSIQDMDLHPKFEKSLDLYIRSIRRNIRDFSEWVDFNEMLS
jgi:mutator protein MutT